MTKSTSSSGNKSDTLIKNKTKLVKAIKGIIDTNGFDYLKNKPYDVYLSLVANKSCSKKVAISVFRPQKVYFYTLDKISFIFLLSFSFHDFFIIIYIKA